MKFLRTTFLFVILLFCLSATGKGKSKDDFSPKFDSPHKQLLKLISLYANYGMPEVEFLEKVEELINKGANPNAHVKTIAYTKKIGAKIFNYREKHWTGYTYTTPFHEAVSKRNITLVEKLIELGANPDKPDRQNTYPIDLALEKKDTSMVFCLLKHGANIKRICLDYDLENQAISKLLKMERIHILFARIKCRQ